MTEQAQFRRNSFPLIVLKAVRIKAASIFQP
jgi:hypothetical protein